MHYVPAPGLVVRALEGSRLLFVLVLLVTLRDLVVGATGLGALGFSAGPERLRLCVLGLRAFRGRPLEGLGVVSRLHRVSCSRHVWKSHSTACANP